MLGAVREDAKSKYRRADIYRTSIADRSII